MKPQNRKNQPKSNQRLSVTKTEVYQGAIPPPDMMEGYKILDSSFPDRILKMAEKEQSHAHQMSSKAHFSVMFQISIGLIAGVLTMASLCWLVFYAVSNSQPTVAIATVSGMAAIIGVFVLRYKK